MLKISATQLEAYRRFIDGWISVGQFERSLLRLDSPNDKMLKGTLFHEMLQASDPIPFRSDFSAECIRNARAQMDYRNSIFEYKARKIYQTGKGQIAVTGIADQLIGYDVVEIKTRYSPFEFESYMNSLQWRVYCELFHADMVHYKVFEFDSPEADNYKSYTGFALQRPFGNHDHVRNYVGYLHEYIIVRGLDKEPVLQLKERL